MPEAKNEMEWKDLLERKVRSSELALNLILQQIIAFYLSRIYDLNTNSKSELLEVEKLY